MKKYLSTFSPNRHDSLRGHPQTDEQSLEKPAIARRILPLSTNTGSWLKKVRMYREKNKKTRRLVYFSTFSSAGQRGNPLFLLRDPITRRAPSQKTFYFACRGKQTTWRLFTDPSNFTLQDSFTIPAGLLIE